MHAAVEARDADTIELREIIARVLSRRWWVIGAILACTLAAAAAAFLMTPVYRGKTVVVATNAGQESGLGGAQQALGQFSGLAAIAGLELGSKGTMTQEALAVLKSREFTERFIAARHLMPVLYASKWDAERNTWRSGVDVPTGARAYRYFNEKIRAVDEDKKTGLVTLQIDWKNRVEAADWANSLVRQLNEEMRARAISEADASLGFLEKELQTTNVVPVRDAIARLIESQVKKRMVANVTEEYVFRIVDHALPADADDPVRPRKVLLLTAGPLVGLLLGILAALTAGDAAPPGTARRPA
jgi:uncharacterized protein involved in exopolysaccharide biosynthesis